MIALIVSTHGRFSEELVRSSEMIFGKQENIKFVTFEPGESVDDLIEKYKNAIKSMDYKDGLLFLVDLFGGSPYNAASRIAINNPDMDIVTGVNLPMLLEIFASRGFLKLWELSDSAVNAGIDSMKSFKSNLNKRVEEEL